MQKFYAVRQGVLPGVYNTWKECQSHINGYPGAQCKFLDTAHVACRQS